MDRLLQLKINRSGIKFDSVLYWHPALMQYINDTVICNLKDGFMKVYNKKGTFICKAKGDWFFIEGSVVLQKKPLYSCCPQCNCAVRNCLSSS